MTTIQVIAAVVALTMLEAIALVYLQAFGCGRKRKQ